MIDEPMIQKMTPLEAIRLRPSMYVRADASGAIADHLLRASMCHGLAELACGTATAVTVSIDGLSASIEDDGIGWPVHIVQNGLRYAERILSEMGACRDHKAHSELAHALCLISLPVVVALSTTFAIDIHRDGDHWRQTYRDGIAEGPLAIVGNSHTTGTTIQFTLDAAFCGDSLISASTFFAWLPSLEPSVPTRAVKLIDS